MSGNPGSGGGSFNAPFMFEIEKYYNGEYWVNRYFSDAADLAGAGGVAMAVVALERAITLPIVTFTKVSVRTTALADEVYTTLPVNLLGTLNQAGDPLPLFNVVRVDIGASVGRPSRKYLRGVLEEQITLGMKITTAMITLINNTYCTPLAQLAGLCDEDGNNFISASVKPEIGMRQLRRGSKKKPIPSTTG
jgi:hypothetical protein